MDNSDTQKNSFQERLSRISGAAEAEPVEQDSLVADYAAWEAAQEAARPKLTPEEARRVMNPGILENIKYPLSFVWALLVGMAAVVLLRFTRFHLFADMYGDMDMQTVFFLDLITLVVVFFIYKTFRSHGLREEAALKSGNAHAATLALWDKQILIIQAVGVYVALSTMHNLYHWMPQQMSIAFSPEWTGEMINWTEANSIYFRGNYYVLHEQPQSEEPAIPRAWSLG